MGDPGLCCPHKHKRKQNAFTIFTCIPALVLWSFHTIVGFFIPVSSLKVFDRSIHSERRRIYLGKSMQALQNDTIIISWVFSFRVIQPTMWWHTFKNFMFVSIIFLFIIKTFRDSRLLKYLINKELMTFSNKIQAKTFTWPYMSFYAR